MAPFDTTSCSSYQSAIVSIALSCTISFRYLTWPYWNRGVTHPANLCTICPSLKSLEPGLYIVSVYLHSVLHIDAGISYIHRVSKKTRQLWQAVDLVSTSMKQIKTILIIFGKQHQHTVKKWYAYSTFLISSLLLITCHAMKWAWQVIFWLRERWTVSARCTVSFRWTVSICLCANFKLVQYFWNGWSYALQIWQFDRLWQVPSSGGNFHLKGASSGSRDPFKNLKPPSIFLECMKLHSLDLASGSTAASPSPVVKISPRKGRSLGHVTRSCWSSWTVKRA